MTKRTKQASISNVNSDAEIDMPPESPLQETTPPSDAEQARSNHENDETDQNDQQEVNRRLLHPGKEAWVVLVLLLSAIAVIAAIALAVLLPRRDSSTYANKRWVSMDVEFSNDAKSPENVAFTENQVHLTSSYQMFEIKKRTNQINIYKYDANAGGSEEGVWALETEISFATEENSDFTPIRNVAPSRNGKRLAVAYPENITVLEESSSLNKWTPITVVTPSMLEPFVNVSSLYKFGQDALALPKDGRLLSLWSALVTDSLTEGNKEYQPALVAAFRDEGEEWRMVDHHDELVVSPVLEFDNPIIAPTGNVVAVRAIGGNGSVYNRKELVNIYDYNLATKWTLVDTVVEPFHSEQQESFFGQSKALSYDGSVLAVGAMNQELGDQRYGLVKVYEKDKQGKYMQKGQTLEAAGGVWRFGEHVALSHRGDRMAVSSSPHGDYKVQVYEFRHGHWELLWNPFSEFDDPIDSLSMSPNGDRVAVEWNCEPRRLRCVSVFEERSL